MTIDYIKNNFIKIIECLMSAIENSDIAVNIPILFVQYGYNYQEYIESDKGFNCIIELIESVIQSNEESLKDEKQESAFDYSVVDEIYDELYEISDHLKSQLFPSIDVDYEFIVKPDKEYWDKKINENITRTEYDESQIKEYHKEHYIENVIDEEEAIDELFIKQI